MYLQHARLKSVPRLTSKQAVCKVSPGTEMLALSAMSNLYAENDYREGKEKWKKGGEKNPYFKRDNGPGFQSH